MSRVLPTQTRVGSHGGVVDPPRQSAPRETGFGLQLFAGVGIGIVLAAAVATALTIARGKASARNDRADAAAASASSLGGKETTAAKLGGVPRIAIDNTDAVTTIEITRAKEAPIKLQRKESAWRIVAPIETRADNESVKTFLAATKTWGLGALVPSGEADRAFGEVRVHVVIERTGDAPIDVSIGGENPVSPKLRVTGHKDTFEPMAFPKGFLNKDLADWRDHAVLRIDASAIERIVIENPHGTFELTKSADTWKASRSAASSDFDPRRVDNLVNAMKSLDALGFAEPDADTGLDKATFFGGQMRFFLKGSKDPIELSVGKAAKGGRYASAAGIHDVFVVSGWVAEWATSDSKKLQKP